MSRPRPVRRPTVTMLDVARSAGVSRATVSRALAGYGRIDLATQEKVQAEADRLGYRTNDLARAMRAGKTATIGLAVPDIANPFFAQATKAIIDTAASLDYQVVIANTGEDPAAERRAVRVFDEKRVDGLIVVPVGSSDLGGSAAVGQDQPPIVIFDRRVSMNTQVTSVSSDDFAAATEAVSLLVRNGHSRIGMIDGNSPVASFTARKPRGLVSAAADRIDGFRAGLRHNSLTPRPGWMLYAQSTKPYAAESAAESLLEGQERPTAIVANNSDVALAIVAVCRGQRLEIGRDLSLISFDDAPWARAFTPAITTVARPVAQMGEVAVRELLAQIEGQPPSPPIVLANTLLERGSVAPIRGRHSSRPITES